MFRHHQHQRATFENYSFQIPPKMCFEKDGNAQFGEYLFVYDPQEKYLISFETGMQCFDLVLQGKEDLCHQKYSDNHMNVSFCYPKRPVESRGYMVYFHAELLTPNGCAHILPGQMSVSSGNAWSSEPESILLELLSRVEVLESRSYS